MQLEMKEGITGEKNKSVSGHFLGVLTTKESKDETHSRTNHCRDARTKSAKNLRNALLSMSRIFVAKSIAVSGGQF